MSSKRKDIRNALKTLFENDVQFDAISIFSSRRSLISEREELPSITLFTPNEDLTPETIDQNRYIRKLQLTLEIRTASTDNVDDDLDTISDMVETFMLANSSINGLVLGSVCLTIETEVGLEANQEIGLCTLNYECTYVS